MHDGHDENRRRLVTAGGLLLGGALLGGRPARSQIAEAGRVMSPDRPLTCIAFGSCAKQDKPQPIWEAVLAKKPDLFVFLGDNVYGDTRDMNVLRGKYALFAGKPGFQRLRASTPTLAIWDDHDFGEDDAGADYPMKEESRRIFLDFWKEPADSPRWSRDGIYTAQLHGPVGRRVQIIMPDLRFNRTPLTHLDLGASPYKEWAAAKREAGAQVPGPYARSAETGATMLGERQWAWLESQLEVPAEIRIIASSLQVVADFPGWEAWINYARDHQRLIDLIRRKRATGVVFISGDTHYAELSKLDVNVPYTLWDLTSSGLTEVWPVDVPNANRVGTLLREPNFGVIEIDWSPGGTTIALQAMNIDGKPAVTHEVKLSDLQLARG